MAMRSEQVEKTYPPKNYKIGQMIDNNHLRVMEIDLRQTTYREEFIHKKYAEIQLRTVGVYGISRVLA